MSRRMLLRIGAMALSIAALVWWSRDLRRDAHEHAGVADNGAQTSPTTDVAANGADSATAPHRQPREDWHVEDGHEDHDDNAPNVDLRARYFETPALRDAHTFDGAETALLIEASCRAQPLMAKSGSAEQRLNTLYAMNPRERFPEDLFYRSLIQFWRYDGQYYQLSAIWDIGLPPTYTLKLHRSATPDFSGAVAQQALPGIDGMRIDDTLDAASASAAMARISDQYVAKGATLGLQILEADWPTADGKGRMRATLANGRPVSWGFPGGACRYDEAAAALRCRCPSAQEEKAPGTS